ncbi:MAG: hypothetical protein M3063_10665 [Actinomycetota bacterium]|nr:hypothetical protein [Actinomycetota bacterium]
MLSRLQEEVALTIARLSEAQELVLAGGAALIARGDVLRGTEDLDFFGLDPRSVDVLLPSVQQALLQLGLDVRIVRAAPGFARLSVGRGDERTEVDLAADARLLPALSICSIWPRRRTPASMVLSSLR